MQSAYETYGEWEKRTFYDNASRRGTGVSLKQCYDGKREYECTVFYDKYRDPKWNSDTMVLCSECREALKREARKHGYGFQSKPIVFG